VGFTIPHVGFPGGAGRVNRSIQKQKDIYEINEVPPKSYCTSHCGI